MKITIKPIQTAKRIRCGQLFHYFSVIFAARCLMVPSQSVAKSQPLVTALGFAPQPKGSIYAVDSQLALDLTDEVTLEAWVQAEVMEQAGGRILDKGIPNTTLGYMLDTFPGNSLRFTTSGGVVSYDARLPANQWTHVVGAYSSSRRILKLYINGREVASNTTSAFPPMALTSVPLRVGSDMNGDNRFQGRIRRVAVYGRALSSDEVAARFAGTAPTTGALGDWTLDANARARIKSSSGGLTMERIAPQVMILPSHAAGYAGEPFSISAKVDAAERVAYQWQRSGVNIAGQNSATLSFKSLAASDAGDYRVVISSAGGQCTTRTMDLSVVAHPDLAHIRPPTGGKTRYWAQASTIVGHNQNRYFNRPLYSNNTSAFVLTGDKPMAKFCSDGDIHGQFFVGLVRGSTTKWLQDASDIAAGFQPDHTTWRVTDPAFPGLVVRLEMTSLGSSVGFAARAEVTGARSGDKLVWTYGGASMPGGSLNTDLDPYRVGEARLLRESFNPAACANNVVEILGGARAGAFSLRPNPNSTTYTLGRCNVGTSYSRADASAWETPSLLTESAAARLPMICGQVALDKSPRALWSFLRVRDLATQLPPSSVPSAAFASGLRRSADFAARFVLETPDARFNAQAAMTVAAIDGTWYGDKFHHGAMAWNVPLIGWRTNIGGTMLGWHDRVRAMANYYLPLQITDEANASRAMDEGRLLTLPAGNSRFFGKGHISRDSVMYDMQTQFFDQILQQWRWSPTEDPAYEAKLRRAVELHLEWARECFDPDNNGTYESVLNTWPTDSVWSNGGGAPDETAYIYRAHAFARDLARRAGDNASVTGHERQMKKIKAALFSQLWDKKTGHFGYIREQGGHGRLINNPWLYSLCLPIDAGMLTPEQAAENLFYTEYGLENDRMTTGGRRVWTSNFTPSLWSARVLWPGDNYMLALSYLQAGFARDGWDILRGTFLHAGFNNLIPGDAADFFGGTDFGDAVHPFARTVIEGVFGYQPDYPNGLVRLAPQIPADWPSASLRTPDVRLRYGRSGRTTTLQVRLQRSSTLAVELPVRASGVSAVTVNGLPVRWQASGGFGCTIIHLSTSASAGADLVVAVKTRNNFAPAEPVTVQGITDSTVKIPVAVAKLVSFSDPQGALQNTAIVGNTISAKLSSNLGYHRVFVRVIVGGLPQTRILNVHTLGTPNQPTTSYASVPGDAHWSTIDMAPQLAANITTIYQQKYLSPRPPTMSARIGTDGYSPWTFTYWGKSAPKITTDKVASLLSPSASNTLITPQGVPFRWGGNKNVAFTSLWDNWPRKVTVPVSQKGDAVWFLICGSTTVIQNRIANAVLHLKYSDGVEDQVELIPPYNYWNLAPFYGRDTFDQYGAAYYTESSENYTVPKPWPLGVELGENCRALIINRKLRPGKVLQQVTLEALSQESVIGLMGLTLMNPPTVPGV